MLIIPKIEARKAESILESERKDGVYILRESNVKNQTYIFSYYLLAQLAQSVIHIHHVILHYYL